MPVRCLIVKYPTLKGLFLLSVQFGAVHSGEGLFYGCIRLFVCFLHNLATTFLWHTAIVSKPKKLSKNLLTKGNCCAIICKLWNSRMSTSGHENGGELRAKNTAKKFWKTFQKPLDKWSRMWYNNQVAQNAAKAKGTFARIIDNWTTGD